MARAADATELWERIDSMPHRRRELRERSAGAQPTRTLLV